MKKNSQSFNLIEILTSMIVIIFAMFIIISFIPLAQNQQAQAINQTHLANFADNMISYIKALPQNVIVGEDSNLNNRLDTGEDLNNNETLDRIVNDRYDFLDALPSEIYSNNTRRSEYSEEAVDSEGSIKIYAHSTRNSLFLIRSQARVGTVDVTEAEVEARLFTADSSFSYNTTDTNLSTSPSENTPHAAGANYASISFDDESLNTISSTTPYDISKSLKTYAIRVIIEFSWPTNRPYEKRRKEFVFFDHSLTTAED